MKPLLRRKRSNMITPTKAAIAKFLVIKLGLYQHQAAALLGVNQGRISEVMTGKKHPKVPPANDLDNKQLSLPIEED